MQGSKAIVAGLLLVLALVSLSPGASYADSLTLWATGSNDGSIHYSTYGSWTSFGAWDGSSGNLPVNTSFFSGFGPSSWERDYSYVEIPIAALRGGTVTSASLEIYSNGFGLGNFWYGSAMVYHLNPGTLAPCGDVAIDNPHTWGTDAGWTLFDTNVAGSGNPGLKSFDVTASILADLTNPDRNFSSFFVQASREVYGSVAAAESVGFGPRLQVQGRNLIQEVNPAPAPIPPAVWLFGSGLVGLIGWRRFRRQ